MCGEQGSHSEFWLVKTEGCSVEGWEGKEKGG